ncbi:MAG: hypothetical protein H6737_14560 [Alphaproteobacteria bacterium]|nr:hypothetical protein [Alphaproteobacteria bacterium]
MPLRFARIVLTLWVGGNLLLALGILAALATGSLPPAVIFLPDPVRAGLDPSVADLLRAMGALLNGAVAALCVAVLGCLWGDRWDRRTWGILATSLGLLQACGFFSDAFLGNASLPANVVSTLWLATGLWGTRPATIRGCPGA